jgi:hypothetical protein
MNQRRHLDGFWPGAKNAKYFEFHRAPFSKAIQIGGNKSSRKQVDRDYVTTECQMNGGKTVEIFRGSRRALRAAIAAQSHELRVDLFRK